MISAAPLALLLTLPLQISGASNETSAVAQTTPITPAEPPAPPRRQTRGELDTSLGLSFGSSSWSGDPLGYGGFTVGLRLWRIVTPYVGAALGYARIDQRLLTRLTVGVSVGIPIADRFFPRIFAAFVHQHEESMASVAEQPFGAILGIGNGIRHRAGVHAGLALDVTLRRGDGWELALGPEFGFMYLTYSSGPSWYVHGGVNVLGRFRLF